MPTHTNTDRRTRCYVCEEEPDVPGERTLRALHTAGWRIRELPRRGLAMQGNLVWICPTHTEPGDR